MLALILCLVATPAFAEREVVIRDKKGTTYLVTYNCKMSAARASRASVVAVGETIKIRGRDGIGQKLYNNKSTSVRIIKLKGPRAPFLYAVQMEDICQVY